MEHILLFIFSFVFVLIIYQLFIVKKAKRRNSKKKPIEIRYLIGRYNVDLKKANYKQMLQIVAITSSLDIAIVMLIISFFERTNIQLLVAMIIVLPIILISYHFVGNFYKKKGMIKDE